MEDASNCFVEDASIFAGNMVDNELARTDFCPYALDNRRVPSHDSSGPDSMVDDGGGDMVVHEIVRRIVHGIVHGNMVGDIKGFDGNMVGYNIYYGVLMILMVFMLVLIVV